MPSLFEIQARQARISSIKHALLGKEFTLGLVTGVVVSVSPDATACVFIGLRWCRPTLFRWPRLHPAHRSPSGDWIPAAYRIRQRGTPLPDHTPVTYGTHLFTSINP
jgi:hypothetical protein